MRLTGFLFFSFNMLAILKVARVHGLNLLVFFVLAPLDPLIILLMNKI